MHNVYLFQPQYAVEYRNEQNYWIPYSVGCIWAYCDQFEDIKQSFSLKDIVFKREDHKDVLARLDDPSVCCFSCYQWNREYSLSLAEKIKNKYPNCVIVFGGPEVTVDYELYSYIDSIVLGEGELAMLDILRSVAKQEKIKPSYPKARLTVEDFPSPYTSGVFDVIVKNNPNVKWATTLETNRGCPFSCTFCDWGSVTYSKVKKFNLERVVEDLNWIAENPISYIFCADANFGILKERDLRIAKLVSQAGKKSKHLEVFNATYNKNNNDWSFKILKELGELNKGFTVSVQSLHQPTLQAIKRTNLEINDLKYIFDLCSRNNISSYTELILGLPLETKNTFINGLCELLELGQHSQIEVWFADLLINSELNHPSTKFDYRIKTVETSNYLALLNQSDDDEYPEKIKLINSTSTMNTEDMIDSYLYAWVIVNFHLQGYSQFTSKYCRKNFNIPYKNFYDLLVDRIKTDRNIFQVYTETRESISSLLYQGKLKKGQSAHNLLFNNADKLYFVRQNIFNLVNNVCCELTGITNPELSVMQQAMIVDIDVEYPLTLSLTVDPTTLEHSVCQYQFDKKQDIELTHFGSFTEKFYALRRKGLLKTTCTQVK